MRYQLCMDVDSERKSDIKCSGLSDESLYYRLMFKERAKIYREKKEPSHPMLLHTKLSYRDNSLDNCVYFKVMIKKKAKGVH